MDMADISESIVHTSEAPVVTWKQQDPATYPLTEVWGNAGKKVLHYWVANDDPMNTKDSYPLCAGKPVVGPEGYVWFSNHMDATGQVSITMDKESVTCQECLEYIHS
jgi:hypothetical protein